MTFSTIALLLQAVEIEKLSSDRSFVEFVADQIDGAGDIRYRKMFGEYALYCGAKVVALICDNQLFVKPTKSGREFIGEVTEAPAYKGAKVSFLIESQLEDRDWLTELISLTEKELPEPKAKKKKNSRGFSQISADKKRG